MLFPGHKFFVGVDANVKLAGGSSGSLIGDAVWRADLSCLDKQRTCAFVEYLQDCSLMVCNTWTHESHLTILLAPNRSVTSFSFLLALLLFRSWRHEGHCFQLTGPCPSLVRLRNVGNPVIAQGIALLVFLVVDAHK